MTHDQFIGAIQDDPFDDTCRLVYADWLEEHGDPRAEYLRTELELARLPADASDAAALRTRLWQAWATVDPSWLAVFTQPRLLRANPTPFPSAWRGTRLGRYRPCNSTYCSWPYDSLPPLPVGEFRDQFQWLEPAPADRRNLAEPEDPPSVQWPPSARMGPDLRLPESFLRFMAAPELQTAIRSVTDCYFQAPEQAIPDPAGSGSFHLTFYCDSQSVLFWDLYIHPSGGHCVLARLPNYFKPVARRDPDARVSKPYTGPRAWFVAPSFESFVYRTWLESEVWGFVHADFMRRYGQAVPPLTPALQAYLSHYEPQPPAPA